MSEYMFGVGRGRVAAKTAKRIDKIARKHDCYFISGTFPGDGPKFWFAGPNRGHPFDQAMARAVTSDLEAAGLYPIPRVGRSD